MNIEIANRLQKLRKEKGYSQEELAEKLGISRQAVSKWERAESSPDTDNLICLARLYNISLDELLKTDDDNETIIEEQVKDKVKRVDIGKDGIHIVDGDEEVHVSLKGIKVNVNDNKIDIEDIVSVNEEEKKENKIVKAIKKAIPIVITVAYILIAAFFDLWHPGWIVFLLIPILITLIESIILKKICAFAYPVFATAIFLFVGCVFKWWHPGWVIFLTIPLFYMIGEQIDNRKK